MRRKETKKRKLNEVRREEEANKKGKWVEETEKQEQTKGTQND